MRPAKLGKDPKYAESDPGARYIPGLSQVWIGMLALVLGIENCRATTEARANLYKGKTPDGTAQLLEFGANPKYRPVFGGNLHAPKSLAAWAAEQPEALRTRFENAFMKAAVEAVREELLPKLQARGGKGGTERMDAATMCTPHFHAVSSDGRYAPHALFEFHNVGLCSDGKFRTLDSSPVYDRQAMVQIAFEARLVSAMYHEFGLVLRPGPKDTLEVKGLEAMRNVETPQRQAMLDEIREAGLPVTPKTLHIAGLKLHLPRNPSATVATAVRTTVAWVRKAGVDVRTAVVERVRKTNELIETKRAEVAIGRAVRAADNLGIHFTQADLKHFAIVEARRVGADPAMVDTQVSEVFRSPKKFGIYPEAPGKFTTAGIELARRQTELAVKALAKRRGKQPSARAVNSLRIGPGSAPSNALAGMAAFGRRGTVVSEPTAALGHWVEAHRRDGRRVIAAAADPVAPQLAKVLDGRPDHPDVLAARLGKPTVLKTVRRLRKTRWRSPAHFRELVRAARRPDLVFDRDDVVVIDERHVSHRSVAAVCRAARKARATVVLIRNPADGPSQNLTRDLTRGPGPHDRIH